MFLVTHWYAARTFSRSVFATRDIYCASSETEVFAFPGVWTLNRTQIKHIRMSSKVDNIFTHEYC